MTRSQRIAILVASAVLAVAAFVLLRPSEEPTEPTAQTTPATPSPAPTVPGETSTPAPTPTATPKPLPLLTAAKPRRVKVKKGETVRFEVRSKTADEVHLHGYDISRDVAAGKTVRMTVKATIEGIFEIELERSGTPVGELEVRP